MHQPTICFRGKRLEGGGIGAGIGADTCAVDPQTQRTHIPHEVKAPWAEGCVGHHFADLLHKDQSKPSIARPAAQLLYHLVRCST